MLYTYEQMIHAFVWFNFITYISIIYVATKSRMPKFRRRNVVVFVQRIDAALSNLCC